MEGLVSSTYSQLETENVLTLSMCSGKHSLSNFVVTWPLMLYWSAGTEFIRGKNSVISRFFDAEALPWGAMGLELLWPFCATAWVTEGEVAGWSSFAGFSVEVNRI